MTPVRILLLSGVLAAQASVGAAPAFGQEGNQAAPVTLTFKGWGSDDAPDQPLTLGFRGWGATETPEQETELSFQGWGDAGVPKKAAELSFKGWSTSVDPGPGLVLSFKGWGAPPPPCHPRDLARGELVAQPRRNPDNDHRYLRFSCATDWVTAEAACRSVGAYLVTIVSERESAFVSDMARHCEGNGCWIGATDLAKEGTFAWITGEPWAFEIWKSGEPNDECRGEDYLHIRPVGDWNDQAVDGSCQNWGLMQYICEWNPVQ